MACKIIKLAMFYLILKIAGTKVDYVINDQTSKPSIYLTDSTDCDLDTCW